MTFAHPFAFYALLGVPLALLLAFLSKRERRYVVASMMPWRAVLALPRPRPARNPVDLETLCAVGAPLLAALALTGPVLHLADAREHLATVVVDTSTSMRSAPAGRPDRLAQAGAWLERLGQHRKGYRITLYATGRAEPLVVAGDAGQACRALERIGVNPQTEAQQEQRLADALAASKTNDGPVLWISDRVAPLTSPRLSSVRVGDPSRNVGLVAASVNRSEDPPFLFAAIQNFSAAPRDVRLEVLAQEEDASASAFRKRMDPGAVHTLRWPLPGGVGGPLVRLTSEADDLAADNEVRLRGPASRTVAIDRAEHDRLALALEKAAGCILVPLTRSGQAEAAVVTSRPGALPRSGLLLVAPSQPCCGLVDVGRIVRATDVRVRPGARPLPAVCVQGLETLDVRAIQLPAEHTVLASARPVGDPGAPAVPLVAWWQWNGRRVVYLGAVPRDWTVHPAFPVLVAELVDRLVPAGSALPGLRESDNRPAGPPTQRLPALYEGRGRARAVPLARLAAGLAVLAMGYLLLVEARRMRTRRCVSAEG